MSYKSARQMLLVLLVVALALGGVSSALQPLPAQAAGSPPPLIRLQYATFNPLRGEPAIPPTQRLTAPTNRPAIFLIQFIGPVHVDWKARVEAIGAQVYGYLPDYAFISRMDSATVEQVQAQTTFNITPPSQTGDPFRVTLAWTDFPGEPAAARTLVNDLDLEVIAPDGTHYYGNQGVYASGQCLRDGKWDQCNNVEGVIISNAPLGAYTIIVRGVNVPHGPQPYALVASGNNAQEGGPTPKSYHVYLPVIRR
jgi:hypothetical protein